MCENCNLGNSTIMKSKGLFQERVKICYTVRTKETTVRKHPIMDQTGTNKQQATC